MYWKLPGLAIALFAVSFAAALLTSIAHKQQGLSNNLPFPSAGNASLSAEEINRRTLQLAATSKPRRNKYPLAILPKTRDYNISFGRDKAPFGFVLKSTDLTAI